MDAVYYVMAILGCGDGNANCQQARIEPVRYRSAAACQAAMAEVLMRNTDLSFPVVAAACEQRGQIMVAKDPARQGG